MKPVRVRLRDGKYRCVEGDSNKLCRNKQDTVMDGGGHESKSEAIRQADYISGRTKNIKA